MVQQKVRTDSNFLKAYGIVLCIESANNRVDYSYNRRSLDENMMLKALIPPIQVTSR